MPAEDVTDAARALARAALGRPVRDLATTRRGTISYALLSLVPRRLMDRLIGSQVRRLVRRGAFAADSRLAGELISRLRA